MTTVGSFLINTDDVGEAEAVLQENFGEVVIRSAPGSVLTRTRIWRNQLDSLTLDEVEYTYGLEYTADPLDKVVLCRLRSGLVRERGPDGEFTAFGPGAVLAYGARDEVPFSGAVDSAVHDMVIIERSALNGVVGLDADPVRLTSTRPLTPAANQLMVDAIDYVRHGVMANAHAGSRPLLAGALTNYLATAVVSAFAVDLPASGTHSRIPHDTGAMLRRAVAFVDENAHVDISAADIAAAANLTPQLLHLVFAKHHGCTPTQYVRRVRLEHAHRELVAADPSATSVADISQRWGFASVSRFAVSYRVAFGRSPSATLRASSARSRH